MDRGRIGQIKDLAIGQRRVLRNQIRNFAYVAHRLGHRVPFIQQLSGQFGVWQK